MDKPHPGAGVVEHHQHEFFMVKVQDVYKRQVHHRVGEVFHIRVSRENMLLIFGIRNIWCFYLNFGVLTLNMLYRCLLYTSRCV